jgi:DNA-binding PadR family transcriptional regulator
VQIPEGAFSTPLTDYQFRLLIVLCHLAGSEGVIRASVDRLASETGNVNEKTVRRALKALEGHGLLSRMRTKRANGYRGVDIYRLNSYGTPESAKSAEIGDSNVRASHDYKSRSHIANKPLVPNSQTSYKLKDIVAQEAPLKEIKISMRGMDDGDDLAGFGLIEPRDVPQQKVSKRDPKTRGKRPEHEWTPMDVAAEFSYRVGRKYPLLPGTVSVKALSGALAKFRKQYGTTPLIELELLRLFMADDSNFRHIGDEAPNLYKLYLASFGKKMNQARDNLGLMRVAPVKDTVAKMATITASDGQEFQNSMSGRAQLDRYEKKLRGK